MKKIYSILLFICCFVSASISIMGETAVNKSCDTAKEIDLKGNLPQTKQRSLEQPIQAFISEESIEVDFNESVGTIVVSISDEAGNAVYQQTVDAEAGQALFIDITSFEEGAYTITFVNSQTDLTGEFEI